MLSIFIGTTTEKYAHCDTGTPVGFSSPCKAGYTCATTGEITKLIPDGDDNGEVYDIVSVIFYPAWEMSEADAKITN